MSSLGGSYNYYGDFDVQSHIRITSKLLRIHCKYDNGYLSAHAQSIWKECGFVLEKEEFRLVSKMITLRYDPIWLNTAVTLKLTKRVDFSYGTAD